MTIVIDSIYISYIVFNSTIYQKESTMINRRSSLSLVERLERLEETVENKKPFLREGMIEPYSKEILDKCVKGTWRIIRSSYSGSYIYVTGIVDLSKKNLSSILEVGKFGTVTGEFFCNGNKLTSLEGAPDYVGGTFQCSNNKLISLKGGPTEVGRNFDCSNNNLTSLIGSPIEVGYDFDCYNNKLISLKGCPRKVGWDFNCYNNPGEFNGSDIRAICNVGKRTVCFDRESGGKSMPLSLPPRFTRR